MDDQRLGAFATLRDGPAAEKADILAHVCAAFDDGGPESASTILSEQYPFSPLVNAGRHYSLAQCMSVFLRDGFIDRYSGRKLVFPGTLRLLSILFPVEFPFQNNWKTEQCHFAFYELFPTIDHRVPVSRGGVDDESNWVSTSMVRNVAKANFTIEELGWSLLPAGDLRDWDGLTAWFLRQFRSLPDPRRICVDGPKQRNVWFPEVQTSPRANKLGS